MIEAAQIAASIHSLYMNPKTRKASSDKIARSAMNSSIKNILRISELLSKQKINPYRRLSQKLDLSMFNALLYRQ